MKSQSNNFFKLINAFQRVRIAKVHPTNCVKFFNSRTDKYEHLCKIHSKFFQVWFYQVWLSQLAHFTKVDKQVEQETNYLS